MAINVEQLVVIMITPLYRQLELKGGRHLPYLEKNIDSLGIVTPGYPKSKSWLLAPSRNISILHRPTVTFTAS